MYVYIMFTVYIHVEDRSKLRYCRTVFLMLLWISSILYKHFFNSVISSIYGS